MPYGLGASILLNLILERKKMSIFDEEFYIVIIDHVGQKSVTSGEKFKEAILEEVRKEMHDHQPSITVGSYDEQTDTITVSGSECNHLFYTRDYDMRSFCCKCGIERV